MRGGLPVAPSAATLPSAFVAELSQDKEAEDDSISIDVQALELRVRNVYTGQHPTTCQAKYTGNSLHIRVAASVHDLLLLAALDCRMFCTDAPLEGSYSA